MVILSLGEVLVFSNGYILIDNLAPKNLKATYHSVSNLFALGFSAGPVLGTWYMEKFGQFNLFLVAGTLLFICSWLYVVGNKYATQGSSSEA